ncbi:MAG: response regulator [Fimbriimonadaceae bacterium]
MAEDEEKVCHDRSRANGENVATNGSSVDILVVEDNDSQRTSIVAALQNVIPDVCVISVHSGAEAIEFLFARGKWTDRAGMEPPRLILLDLELPGKNNSMSVLGQIRSIEPEDALTVAPVVIFTDSLAPADVKESYRCGANSYILKPISFHDFKKVVETIGKYWMKHNRTVV